MKDSGKFSDKGKRIATSPVKARDFIKAQSQEKLTLDPQHDILKGGSGKGETSKQQETSKQLSETTIRIYESNIRFMHDLTQKIAPEYQRMTQDHARQYAEYLRRSGKQ